MSDKSDPANENGLIIQPSTGLMNHSEDDSPVGAVPGRRAGEEQEFEIAAGVKIVMCWIPPGEFLMGSPEDEVGRLDFEVQHRITISQGFWLGKYQVIQAQWEAVMGSNPSGFKGSNLPVEEVSWDAISEPGGFMEKANRSAAVGGTFSLPTEAQWEYACRAGTVTALNNGKNLTTEYEACPNLDELGWYRENSGCKTHPVGQKKANGWGLHDMLGNVREWCVDWHEDYTDRAQVDPRGPISGLSRVFRGGSWYDGAFNCRVAGRSGSYPANTSDGEGFRLARSSVPSSVQKCDDVEACVADDGKLHSSPKSTTWL